MTLKPLFLTLSIALSMALLFGCAAEEEVALTAAPLADGAFLLGDVTMTEEGEVTVLKRAQMKIYANDRFMFAFMHEELNKPDVGAGVTEWKDGALIESPIFNQDGPLDSLHFSLDIQKIEGGFLQSIEGLESNGHVYDMVETWDRLPGQTSIFDGLWKLDNREAEAAGELNQFSEIKIIGGGHFIFSQSFLLEGEMQQHFGFGEFSVDVAGIASETMMASSFGKLPDESQLLSLELVDENHFNQIFMWEGRSVTQSYIRQ
ncbi:MAG: hypothetical protein QNK52_05020 [Porticoccaceae bacterium]